MFADRLDSLHQFILSHQSDCEDLLLLMVTKNNLVTAHLNFKNCHSVVSMVNLMIPELESLVFLKIDIGHYKESIDNGGIASINTSIDERTLKLTKLLLSTYLNYILGVQEMDMKHQPDSHSLIEIIRKGIKLSKVISDDESMNKFKSILKILVAEGYVKLDEGRTNSRIRISKSLERKRNNYNHNLDTHIDTRVQKKLISAHPKQIDQTKTLDSRTDSPAKSRKTNSSVYKLDSLKQINRSNAQKKVKNAQFRVYQTSNFKSDNIVERIDNKGGNIDSKDVKYKSSGFGTTGDFKLSLYQSKTPQKKRNISLSRKEDSGSNISARSLDKNIPSMSVSSKKIPLNYSQPDKIIDKNTNIIMREDTIKSDTSMEEEIKDSIVTEHRQVPSSQNTQTNDNIRDGIIHDSNLKIKRVESTNLKDVESLKKFNSVDTRDVTLKNTTSIYKSNQTYIPEECDSRERMDNNITSMHSNHIDNEDSHTNPQSTSIEKIHMIHMKREIIDRSEGTGSSPINLPTRQQHSITAKKTSEIRKGTKASINIMPVETIHTSDSDQTKKKFCTIVETDMDGILSSPEVGKTRERSITPHMHSNQPTLQQFQYQKEEYQMDDSNDSEVKTEARRSRFASKNLQANTSIIYEEDSINFQSNHDKSTPISDGKDDSKDGNLVLSDFIEDEKKKLLESAKKDDNVSKEKSHEQQKLHEIINNLMVQNFALKKQLKKIIVRSPNISDINNRSNMDESKNSNTMYLKNEDELKSPLSAVLRQNDSHNSSGLGPSINFSAKNISIGKGKIKDSSSVIPSNPIDLSKSINAQRSSSSFSRYIKRKSIIANENNGSESPRKSESSKSRLQSKHNSLVIDKSKMKENFKGESVTVVRTHTIESFNDTVCSYIQVKFDKDTTGEFKFELNAYVSEGSGLGSGDSGRLDKSSVKVTGKRLNTMMVNKKIMSEKEFFETLRSCEQIFVDTNPHTLLVSQNIEYLLKYFVVKYLTVVVNQSDNTITPTIRSKPDFSHEIESLGYLDGCFSAKLVHNYGYNYWLFIVNATTGRYKYITQGEVEDRLESRSIIVQRVILYESDIQHCYFINRYDAPPLQTNT